VATIRVGVPWLSEQDWSTWAESDPGILPYDIWRMKADDAISELKNRHVVPVTITVGPRAFAEWCRIEGKSPDKHSRCEYAAVRLSGADGVSR
jgi:hypothetical protein